MDKFFLLIEPFIEILNPIFVEYGGVWITVAILLLFFRLPYRRLVIFAHRQKLYQLREEWFDYAREGNISFENEEYRDFRDFIHFLIRRLDYLDIWFYLSFKHKYKHDFNDEISMVLDREKERIIYEANKVLFSSMIYRSLPFLIIYIFMIIKDAIKAPLDNKHILWVNKFTQSLPIFAEKQYESARQKENIA